MDQLYRDTRRLIMDCRNMLETLESASSNVHLDPAAASPVSASFRETLSKLSMNATTLRRDLNNEPPSRRQVWKARLRNVDDQIGELKAGETRCAGRFRNNAREKQMRDDLLNLNQRKSTSVGVGVGVGGVEFKLGDESKRLESSTNLAEGIVNSGKETFQNLINQKHRLRGTKKKILDVLHQIGVDRSLIANIEKRERFDLLLVCVGMFVLLVLLGLAVLWKYHRRRHAV